MTVSAFTNLRIAPVAIALAALVVLALACGGGGPTGSTPESVVRTFYGAVLDGDLDAMEETFSGSMDPDMRGLLLRAFSRWQQATDARKDAIRISDLFVRQQGDTAEVDVTFIGGTPDTVVLVLEEGSWRIENIE